MLQHVKELLHEQMCSGHGERSRVTCRVTGRGFWGNWESAERQTAKADSTGGLISESRASLEEY